MHIQISISRMRGSKVQKECESVLYSECYISPSQTCMQGTHLSRSKTSIIFSHSLLEHSRIYNHNCPKRFQAKTLHVRGWIHGLTNRFDLPKVLPGTHEFSLVLAVCLSLTSVLPIDFIRRQYFKTISLIVMVSHIYLLWWTRRWQMLQRFLKLAHVL